MMKRNNVFPYLTLLFASLFVAQIASFSQVPKNVLFIEITHIDTLPLLASANDTMFSKTDRSVENTLAQVVHFKILEKTRKLKPKAKKIIVTELAFSEHTCHFDFQIGERYILPIHISKYGSELIRKELQGWHYRTSCWNMPTLKPEKAISFKK